MRKSQFHQLVDALALPSANSWSSGTWLGHHSLTQETSVSRRLPQKRYRTAKRLQDVGVRCHTRSSLCAGMKTMMPAPMQHTVKWQNSDPSISFSDPPFISRLRTTMYVSSGKAQIQEVAQNRSANHAYPQFPFKAQCRLTVPATIHRDSFQKRACNGTSKPTVAKATPWELPASHTPPPLKNTASSGNEDVEEPNTMRRRKETPHGM